MMMNDIGMIAADTTRTFHYLNELITNKLFPKFVLLLINTDNNLMPGQKEVNSIENLLKLLEGSNIQYKISSNSDVNSNEVVNQIRSRNETVFIFSGFGGILLRDSVLATGKRFLHVHGGYLPNYKGSTTNYFSLIEEGMIGASSIFLTKDIDCGPIILRKKFKPPRQRAYLDHVHDSEVRAKVLVETLQNYVVDGEFKFELESNVGGETFYIIHPVLKHIAIMGN